MKTINRHKKIGSIILINKYPLSHEERCCAEKVIKISILKEANNNGYLVLSKDGKNPDIKYRYGKTKFENKIRNYFEGISKVFYVGKRKAKEMKIINKVKNKCLKCGKLIIKGNYCKEHCWGDNEWLPRPNDGEVVIKAG